jgi:hypothetical protein
MSNPIIPIITNVIGTALPFLLDKKKTIKEGKVEIVEEPKLSASRVTQFGGASFLITVGIGYVETNFKAAVLFISAGLVMALGMEIIKRKFEK